MEFRNLYSFLRVAELGSFTKAAEELGYAQSSVTAQIKQLEMTLQTPLFEHVGRRTVLTHHGEALIPYASRILKTQEEILSLMHPCAPEEIRGTLRIGVVESIMNSLLLDNVRAYRKRFPHVMIQFYPAVTRPLFEMLRCNEVDLIFTMGDQIDDPGCVCALDHDERAYFICSPDNPLAQAESLSLATILDQPLLLTGEVTYLRRELNKAAHALGRTIQPVIQSESSTILINLTRQDLGISFLPEYLVRHSWLDGTVAMMPVTDFSLTFQTHVFYHKNKCLTPMITGLIDIIQDYWASIDPLPGTQARQRSTEGMMI